MRRIKAAGSVLCGLRALGEARSRSKAVSGLECVHFRQDTRAFLEPHHYLDTCHGWMNWFQN